MIEDKTACLGWTFKNKKGTMSLNYTLIEEHVSSPLLVEALAVRAAFLDAHYHGWHNLCLKSDANELIKTLKTYEYNKETYRIMKDIKHLSSMFSFISFMYVSRSDNVLADVLAKNALNTFLMDVP